MCELEGGRSLREKCARLHGSKGMTFLFANSMFVPCRSSSILSDGRETRWKACVFLVCSGLSINQSLGVRRDGLDTSQTHKTLCAFELNMRWCWNHGRTEIALVIELDWRHVWDRGDLPSAGMNISLTMRQGAHGQLCLECVNYRGVN